MQIYLNLVKKTSNGWYTAGVVEFAALTPNASESPQDLLLRNAHRYVDIITKAAEHVCIYKKFNLNLIFIVEEIGIVMN